MLGCFLVAFSLCQTGYYAGPTYYAVPPPPPVYYQQAPVYTYPAYTVVTTPPVVVRFNEHGHYHHGWGR